MKFYKAFLCAAALIVPFACTVRNTQQTGLKEGISGQVTFAEGNMMPGPGQTGMKARGVQRKVYIYKVAAAADAEGQAPLFKAVRTKLVATVSTDTAGYYSCKLKPGRYSVLTGEENGQLFSSLSNDKGEISPAEVLPNEVLLYNILLNYKAAY
ncbi:carboxypeptidase regulatory-like domain-containing protein [Pedobacter hartonius]|nr:carboxypeptidase regulatory-like domain-containing protein [Pedobacter hartonius]